MRRTVFSIVIIILFSVPTCTYAAGKQPINDVYAILFVMDGLNYDTFITGIKNGSAPNIEKYFIDDGAYFTNALTVFPSASPNAYQSFISGLFPGHAGIPYLGWFDRTLQKPINYFSHSGFKHLDSDLLNYKALLDPEEEGLYPPSTIFDQLKGHETAAVYSFYGEGSTVRRPVNPIPAFWSVFGSACEEMLDRYSFNEVLKLYNRSIPKVPRFTLVGLYGFDSLAHHYGAKSPIVEYDLEQFDRFLARFITLLKERGIFDKTYIILASDHGMHDTPRSRFDLEKYVKGLGLTLYNGNRRRGDYDTFIGSRGVASAHIYIKGANGWHDRPTYERIRNFPLNSGENIDILKGLLRREEIGFVVVRDGFYKTNVFSKTGHGVITWSDRDGTDKYSYEVEEGGDPLELTESGAVRLINSGFHSADQWGRATAEHKYSDPVVQLAQIFADGRSGDIFAIAENDWVFYRGKSATHGSIIRDDMHIIFMIRGPTVPAGEYGFARAADLYPTMLDWFGIEGKNGHYDGRHLFRRRTPDAGHHRIPDFKRVRGKLETIYSELERQKAEPDKYHFTPGVVLDANMWLVGQQLERITDKR